MDEIDSILIQLKKSKFRGSFHLSEKDIKFINEKGMKKINDDARYFIEKRLMIKNTNDGSQTPWSGHPVFIAQHATATCCRKCIKKWYKINSDSILSEDEMIFINELIIRWINFEFDKHPLKTNI